MKKKLVAILLVGVVSAGTLAFAGCEEHKHSFTNYVSDGNATCTADGTETAKCDGCEETDTRTEEGSKKGHNFTQHDADSEHLVSTATCTKKAVYYISCSVCGENGTETFEYGEFDPEIHTFDKKVAEAEFLKSVATVSKKAEYFYSCECGEKGTQSFEYGEKLQASVGLKYELNTEGTQYTLKSVAGATNAEVIVAEQIDGIPVTTVGAGVFCDESGDLSEQAANITNIILPDSITTISDAAFMGGMSLKNFTIPESVTTIGNNAFYFCLELSSIYISKNVTNLGTMLFARCAKLESIIIDEANEVYKSVNNCILSKDGTQLLGGCTGSVIPDGVTVIVDNAFGDCDALTEAVIPDGVTSIGDSAFEQCSNLISVTIPASVKSIGEAAFKHCNSIRNIIFNGTKEQWNNIEKGNQWNTGVRDYVIQFSDGTKIDENGNEIA